MAIAIQKLSMINCFWVPLFLNRNIVANDTNPEEMTASIKKRLASILNKMFPLSSPKTGSNQINTDVEAARKSHNVWMR